MSTRVSPAATAAVAQRLKRAGITASTEIAARVFSAGFEANMQDDHVQITWQPWPWEMARQIVRRTHLAACEHFLKDHYTVTHATAQVAVPGGWEEQEVLEVRSERWGR